jgi:hypothetical protein
VGWNGGDDHKGLAQLLGAIKRLVRDPATPPDVALRDAEEEDRPPPPQPPQPPQPPSPPVSGAKPRRWPLLAGVAGAAAAVAVGFIVIGEDTPVTTEKKAVSTASTVQPPPEPDARDFQTAAGIDRGSVSAIPGKYPFTSERYLSASDLRTLSGPELKIMRNEIFARHGYIFKTDAMNRYFSRQPWYRPQSDNVIDRLSPIELANVTTIKAAEKRR